MNKIKVVGNILDETNKFKASGRVYDGGGIAPTLGSCHFQAEKYLIETRLMENERIKEHGSCPTSDIERHSTMQSGGVVDLNYPDSQTRRGRVIENGEICPTLTTENIPNVLEEWIWEVDGHKYLIRIRKLTPRECWRLMDFSDEDFDKAESVNSNTQLYKQAGNSIVKNVLCEVFKQLIDQR